MRLAAALAVYHELVLPGLPDLVGVSVLRSTAHVLGHAEDERTVQAWAAAYARPIMIELQHLTASLLTVLPTDTSALEISKTITVQRAHQLGALAREPIAEGRRVILRHKEFGALLDAEAGGGSDG